MMDSPAKGSKQIKDEVNMGLAPKDQLSDRSVRRLAVKNGLHSRRPAVKPPLTQGQKAARLQFAQDHLKKDMRYWGHVIFTDEVKVELHPMDGRQRVRRPIHKRFHPRYVVRGLKGKGPSLMFWGGITLRGQGRLFRIDGTLDGHGYGQILQLCIPEIIRLQNLRAPILQEDNARVHTSQAANQVKEELGLKALNWPSYSPDLNPIEGIWSYWKDRVRRRIPGNIDVLEQICREEWRRIPLTVIQAHVASMPCRLQAIVKARGGDIKY